MIHEYEKQNGIAKRIASKIPKRKAQMHQDFGSAPIQEPPAEDGPTESGIYVICDVDGMMDGDNALATGTKEQLQEAWWNELEQNKEVGGWSLISQEEFNDLKDDGSGYSENEFDKRPPELIK